MASGNTSRIQKELMQVKNLNDKLRNVETDDSDLFVWNGVLYPTNPPYNRGAFKICMIFPKEYPFKPPVIHFKTQIFHPNIDEQGKVCLNIINPEFWKPATRVINVVDALVKLIDEPEPDHPLRPDVAEMFVRDKKRFLRAAEEFTRKNSERR